MFTRTSPSNRFRRFRTHRLKRRIRSNQLTLQFSRVLPRRIRTYLENRCPGCGAEGYVDACHYRCPICGFAPACSD